MKKNQKPKKKKTNVKWWTVLSLVFVLGLVAMIAWVTLGGKTISFVPFEVEARSVKVKETAIANSQAVGWIRVQGTNIDYPVIYDTHEAYDSKLDYTWITHRPTTSENRLVIYGHNLRNVSSEPVVGDESFTRFEQLMSFVYEDFAKNNLYIQYSHDGVDDVYLIYAVGFAGSEETGKTTGSLNETKQYIQQVKDNSLYSYDVEVDENDTLLSLITCTRYFGLDGKTQFRIDARKLRENEKIEQYAVEKTSNYDIIK